MAIPSTKGKNKHGKSDYGKGKSNQDKDKHGKEKPPRIEPLFNDVFIRVFGSSESKTLTRSFINAILRAAHIEEIGELEQLIPESTDVGGSIDCRSARYDVKILTESHILDLEAQRHPEDITTRSLFYGAKLLTSSALKGTDYKDMQEVTIITLLDTQSLFPDDEDFIWVCNMHWESTTQVVHKTASRLRFVLVELAKVRERYNKLDEHVLADETLAWLYVITTGFEKEASVQQVAETFPTIEEFATLYGYAIGDPKAVATYELALECWREERSYQRFLDRVRREGVEEGVEQGRQQGLSQGMEQGRKQGRQALLVDLVNTGQLPLSVAAQQLGITESEFSKLLN